MGKYFLLKCAWNDFLKEGKQTDLVGGMLGKLPEVVAGIVVALDYANVTIILLQKHKKVKSKSKFILTLYTILWYNIMELL